MIENDVRLLDAMLEDQKRFVKKYWPGPYWEGYAKRVKSAIYKSGIENFRSNHAISKGYADSIAIDPATQFGGGSWKAKVLGRIAKIPIIEEKVFLPYLKYIKHYYIKMHEYRSYYYQKEYGDWLNGFDFPDTLVGNCEEFVEINGKKISLNYIHHLIRIHNFEKHINFREVRTVFEIGGGFGANIHLLLHLYPNIRKVLYLDIPPILYVSTQYLKHFYRVKDYINLRYEEKICFGEDDDIEIIAICPWQIEVTDVHIDLFWNSSSFQEMEEYIIRNYILFLNRFMNHQGKLCLQGQPMLRTNPKINFISILKEVFEIEEIEPSVGREGNDHYYLGSVRSS